MGMSAVKRRKGEVRPGRIDAARLVDLVVTLQRHLQEARRRIEELEQKLGGSATIKVEEPFLLRAEEQRQEAGGKQRPQRKPPQRRGRLRTAEKVALAERTEQFFPAGVAANKPCTSSQG